MWSLVGELSSREPPPGLAADLATGIQLRSYCATLDDATLAPRGCESAFTLWPSDIKMCAFNSASLVQISMQNAFRSSLLPQLRSPPTATINLITQQITCNPIITLIQHYFCCHPNKPSALRVDYFYKIVLSIRIDIVYLEKPKLQHISTYV